MMNTRKIILASGSPRRRELLRGLGLEFEIYKPEVDESRLDNERPEDLCKRLSRIKARAGSQKFHDSIIIAADTIVAIDGLILGKPSDRNEAFDMLRTLQGREHEVLTGLTVCDDEHIISHVEHTRVKFRQLSDSQIKNYISSGECDDKAGAYAVQGKGALLVEGLDGDYFNVVGLPVCALGRILAEFGINIL